MCIYQSITQTKTDISKMQKIRKFSITVIIIIIIFIQMLPEKLETTTVS